MRVWVLVVAAGLAGCAGVQAISGADKVNLSSNIDTVKGCNFITQKTVNITSLEAYGPDLLTAGIITKMKNSAVQAGATNVITSGPQSQGAGAIMITGDLYRCP